MTWSLSSEPARLQLARVHAWLASSYWSPGIRKEVVERAFSHSLFVGAYDGDDQVGVARVVTDQATFAWICDVFVAESHRGLGIARAMVEALMADPRCATLRRWCLGTHDAHEVYRALGFGPVNAERWMELLPPRENWSDGSR